jgi:diacylglycerol kinase (ATP)
MNYEKMHFLINPTSGGGSAGKNWATIRNHVESKLGKFSFEFSTSRGHAKELAFQAGRNSVEKIIVIGGDGTISEVVTGVRASGNHDLTIGVLNLGTGGDFCRTLGVPGDVELALEKILSGRVTEIDIGQINYLNNQGKVEERNFINITGCGMSGLVVKTINQSKKIFGGFSYYLASLQNFFSYRNQKIKLHLDNQEPKNFQIVNLAICNGQYFGGGMNISPKSSITDGLFHIVVIENWTALQKILYSSKLYNGSILNAPGVHCFTAKKVKVIPEEGSEVFIDNDGEDIGKVPLEATILPKAIKFFT